MYILVNSRNRVVDIREEKPKFYKGATLYEVDTIPEKYDYLTITNPQEKTRVIKEAYTEEVPKLNEETGEEYKETVNHEAIIETYLTCDLVANFYTLTAKQLEKQKQAKYERLVTQYIRQEYSQDEVEAILNNYIAESENEKYKTEFIALQNYRTYCKAKAKMEVYGV